ncbi:hypothetical protein Leryth_006583 [Lithospermum erythrorhizon]|nr:hypothetical protein Leryth_006583 [Lithospermum erythrorhizon]
MFDICLSLQQTVEQEKWIMCNTCYEIETAACNLIPKMLPVGPLIDFSSSQDIAGAGSFWSEDTKLFVGLDENHKQRSSSVCKINNGRPRESVGSSFSCLFHVTLVVKSEPRGPTVEYLPC